MVHHKPDDNQEVSEDDRISGVPDSRVAQFATGRDPSEAFATLLERVRRDVDARLAGYLDARVSDTAHHGADVGAMAHAIRDLT